MNTDKSASQHNTSDKSGSASSTSNESAKSAVTDGASSGDTAAAPAAPAAATGTGLGQDGRTVNEFVNRVADSLHETVDQAAAAAAPRVEHLQASIEELEDQAREQAEQVLGRAEQCTASLRTSVREHPLAAIGAAFFAGFLMARLAR